MSSEGFPQENIYEDERARSIEGVGEASLVSSGSPLAEQFRMLFTEAQVADFDNLVFNQHGLHYSLLDDISEEDARTIASLAAPFFEVQDRSERRALARKIAEAIERAS